MNWITGMKIALLLSSLSLIGVTYLLSEHFNKPTRTRGQYQAELDRYFVLMRDYGFTDDEIIKMLFDIENFEQLKESNRKASKHLNKTIS